MSLPTVACVLRSGAEYNREHVLALYRQVARWWPPGEELRFIALSDAPIHYGGIETRAIGHTHEGTCVGWWAKMALFHPAQEDLGDILYFDLDTLIVGDLYDIVHTSGFTMLSDFGNPWAAQSGMMLLPRAVRRAVREVWGHGFVTTMRRFRGDGEFLDSLYRDTVQRWQTVIPDQIVSFKYHVRQNPGLAVPAEARVICYHGKPRPWNTPLWAKFASLSETPAT